MPITKRATIREPLKCSLPFDEALRRAMLVKPPKDWKKAIKSSRKARR
jgi:hypothetical protein